MKQYVRDSLGNELSKEQQELLFFSRFTWIVSTIKKSKKKAAETLLMQNAPAHTPKAQVGQPFNDIIPHSDQKNKYLDRKSSSHTKVTPETDATYLSAVKRGDILPYSLQKKEAIAIRLR